ncbi:Alpha/beta hydrolase fold-1 [Mycena capillaripes]|nr:Alpha/beta hydrolase fold-1 [Mycena capillaripes]
MSAHRYSTRESRANIGGLTLVFGHGIGAHKEQWEPIIEEIFGLQQRKMPHQRVCEAWALDRQNHGDTALLNQEELARGRQEGVSAYEWAEAIAAFARSPLMLGKRIVPIAHSAGVISMVGSTKFMNVRGIPYAGLILVEPSMVAPDLFHRYIERNIPGLSAAIHLRRDTWASREAAHQWFKTPWSIWDPREHGLVETADGKVTLKCHKSQEATCYPDTYAHFDSVEQVRRICRTVPIHIVWGSREDLVPEAARGSISDRTKGRAVASITRMKGGHMLVQEKPNELAFIICQLLDTISQLLDTVSAVPEAQMYSRL